MSWINIIDYKNATGKLKKLYDRVKGPDNNVDNILLAHSLRPHSLEGHMALYKNVLHNSNNTLPKWYLETLGVYVSYLNQCDYCVHHHYEGLRKLLKDDVKASHIKAALTSGQLDNAFEGAYFQGLQYAAQLTQDPSQVQKTDLERLRQLGLSDGEILEINQVVSYFNYANRTVLGLGVNTEGDILGLSPNESSDAKNWSHS